MHHAAVREVFSGDSRVRKRRLIAVLGRSSDVEHFRAIYLALDADDDFIAAAALKVIASRANTFPVDLDMLVHCLQKADQKPALRLLISRAIAEQSGPVVNDLLISMLRDEDAVVRAEAVESLLRRGSDVIDDLARVLASATSPWFAREAASLCLSLLSQRADLNVASRLETALENAPEDLVLAVVRAVAEAGDENLHAELQKRLNVEDAAGRDEIRQILRQPDRAQEMEELVAAIGRVDEGRCRRLLTVLGREETGIEDLMELEDILRTTDSRDVLALIIRVMGLSRNEKVVPVIASYLQDPDDRVRADAVEALTDAGVEYVVELVRPLLTDFNNRVRANTAKGLWKLGGVGVLQTLRQMLSEPDKWMRASACYALGEIGVFQVIEILLPAMSDPEPDVRINAARALARTGDETAITAVFDLARNRAEIPTVRRQAILALARTKDSEIMGWLQEMQADELDSHLRETLRIVLEELGTEEGARE